MNTAVSLGSQQVHLKHDWDVHVRASFYIFIHSFVLSINLGMLRMAMKTYLRFYKGYTKFSTIAICIFFINDGIALSPFFKVKRQLDL